MTMTPIEMAEAMEGRARVRRKITNRENTGDRLSDQLEQAATMLRQQEVEIERITSKHEEMLRQQQAEIEALKEPKIPLLDQEIKFILGNGQCWQGEDCSMPNLMYIIRAVEAAHGIGVKQNEQ